MSRFTLLSLSVALLLAAGCSRAMTNRSIVRDVQPDADQGLTLEEVYVYQVIFDEPVTVRETTELYPDGRPKRIAFHGDALESVAVEFYPNRQLKSEQRYHRCGAVTVAAGATATGRCRAGPPSPAC